jgi:hypothetical protein
MKKKILLLVVTVIIALILLIFLNNNIKKKVYQLIPEKLQIVYKIIFKDKKFYTKVGNNKIQDFRKDYNVRFLPETQLIKINFLTKNLNFLNNQRTINQKTKPSLKEFKNEYIKKEQYQKENYYKYFIEKSKNKIIFVNDKGVISEVQINKLLEDDTEALTPKIIKSNLANVKILDIYVHENTLFLSAIDQNSKCMNEQLDLNSNVNNKKLFGNYIIFSSKISSEFYNFEKFYKSEECGKNIMGGRIKSYKFNKSEGILFTTSDSFRINGTPNLKSQNLKSIYGKTIFIDFKDRNIFTYSMGHRNAQGLFVENDVILQTEHGPRGGDEINNIVIGNNYGWPHSTYGTIYPYGTLKKPKYKKNHNLNGFEEPIFSYVPSIGISEIIKVPDTFYPNFWKNNFLISSLGARSLFRVKFDTNYKKILFNEKILIGERIRDMTYIDELNIILLSLENSTLGILKKP